MSVAGPHWKLQVVEVPITIGSLDAYTAGDVVGGLLTSEAIEQIRGGGYIAWVRMVDDNDQAEGYSLYCFYDTPSTIADDAAFAPLEADWTKWFTTITIAAADYDQSGSDAGVMADGKDATTGEYHLFPNLDGGLLKFYLVATDTPDYADADDLTMHLGVMVM